MKHAAVIVDSKETLGIRDVVLQHMAYLPGWDLVFFHGSRNRAYIKNQLAGIPVKILALPEPSFPWEVYNRIFTSMGFWEILAFFDKVLIFHPDSGILTDRIKDFMQWDYVGAPWTFQQHGGNGGFSLRTPKVMLEILRRYKYGGMIDGNEDVWFSNVMFNNNIGRLAPRAVCSEFSVEAIFQLGTFGYHAIEKWLTPDQVNQIMTQYDTDNN